MDCNCKSGKFWLGLGLGSLLGMVAYHCAKSEKAKIWRDKVSCAAQSAQGCTILSQKQLYLRF